MSIEPARGIQLKEGSFTFPVQAKYRVDVTAIKEIPRKFEICQQGVEALNDLFYEAPPEQKEGVLVQKAIWENVQERILPMKVFNASSSYTDLSNQLLPIRVLLPDEKQYFPIDLVLKKEPTNPFKETKRFARELLDIVASIKTLRDEKLFQYPDFHIYPGKEAFTVTDTETGERRITIGIHSMSPEDMDKSLSTESLSVKAIKELIQQRWDKREFRKVLAASDLNGMFQALKRLSLDIPTWKMLLIQSGYAAVYSFIGFIIFSILMVLFGLVPGNQPLLEEMKIFSLQPEDRSQIPLLVSAIPVSENNVPVMANVVEGRELTTSKSIASPIRIILPDAQKRSDSVYQVVGTFRSPYRLGKIHQIFTVLDRLYNLNYKAPLKMSQFKCEPELTLVQLVQTEDETAFKIQGLKKWGREKIKLVPAAKDVSKKESSESSKIIMPDIELEFVALKPAWTLEMNPSAISFQQAEAGKKSISTDTINIYSNPTDKEKEKGEKVVESNLFSYFTVSFDRVSVTTEIHYLDPKGTTVAQISFSTFEEGRLNAVPKQTSVLGKKVRPEDTPKEDMEPEGTSEEEEEGKEKPKEKPASLKGIDTFWLKRNDSLARLALKEGLISGEQLVECIKVWEKIPGKDIGDILLQKKLVKEEQYKDLLNKFQPSKKELAEKYIYDVYYRLPQIPKNVNAVKIVVPATNLPSEQVNGNLHIAVPGIEKALSVPITFHAKQKIEFNPSKIPSKDEDIRNQVTGIAFPIELQKSVWGSISKLLPHELRYFTFQIKEKPDNQHIEGFGALGLGLQIKDDPNTIFFYNTEHNLDKGESNTYTITEYSRKSGNIYFTANKNSYGKAQTDFFEIPDKNDKRMFDIREAIAKTTTHLYIMILTDKNVEDSSLTIKWRGGEVASVLPIIAKSKEALRIVQWKPETTTGGISRYTPKDWIEKLSVTGPLGSTRFQAIVFSGEQPDKDVSDEVYLQIQDPNLANILYQTVDGDWFANLEESANNIKLLNTPPSQLSVQKFAKDKDKEKKDKETYFRAEQKETGRVDKYLAVPGKGVTPDQKEKSTQIRFYYPIKDMEATLDLTVSCSPAEKVSWQVSMDNNDREFQGAKKKVFKIRVANYPRSQAPKLAQKILFLTTCASVSLLHSQYHNDGKANDDDKKWAETIRWSLESVGFNLPPAPPGVLGQLGERFAKAIKDKDEKEIQNAYQITRETLLLSWSQQAQSLLQQHLGLDQIVKAIESGTPIKNKTFELDIKLQPVREFPLLINEPERFIEISFTIPYDKLILDKDPSRIYQFGEDYYYGIPQNFGFAQDITGLLSELYPYPNSFPKQTTTLDSGIQVSDILYSTCLKYSLWEQRLRDFSKTESKFWVAMMCMTTDISDPDGKIDAKEVDALAREIQDKLRTYFISPINIKRVYWSEVQDKVRGEADKNRDMIGKQEQDGLTQFVERAMMSQITETNKCWYANFSFVIDRLMLDRAPYHKWIYMKTYRPPVEGYATEDVNKLRLFKRDGLSISPYPGGESSYSVNIYSYGDTDTKIVDVKGITVFQEWFDVHSCTEVGEAKTKDRLRIKLYYEEGGEEKELFRPGTGGPPIINLQADPAAIMLFEVRGYHVSPDRFRELVRKRDFTIQRNKGTSLWNWTFSFDTGPILTPFAYKIKRSPFIVVSYSGHILNWKQDPPPEEKDRSLEALENSYEMEFLYLDTKAQLGAYFFPYNDLLSICNDYDKRNISSNGMLDLLENLFKYSDQIPKAKKIKLDKDLTDFYKQKVDKDQMFSYTYASNHELRITVPSVFSLPKDYKGKSHPELTAPAGVNMAVIWRIMPKDQTVIRRGFPKYILEKKWFPNSESIFSRD